MSSAVGARFDAMLSQPAEVTALSNGVRVVTERMPGVASASLGVWIAAGARHESAAENGVAHFLEHMAFKGTERRTARRIAEEIEDVGGYLNAYTSREATAYYARVLADDAPLAFDILADILRAPQLAEEDVEVERGVILQEIGQTLDTPDDVIWDWSQARAFPDQPIGRSILGSADNVSAFERGSLSRFMRERYAPDRIAIAAAGAVEHDAIVAAAERLFGDLPAFSAPEAAPATYRGGEDRIEKDLEQAHLLVGFQGPGYRDPGFYAAQVYATLLGGGMSSRLFQEAREIRGLCYAIFAQPASYAETGLLSIYAGASGEDLGALLDVIADQIRASAEDISVDEIARARAQMRAGALMSLESPSARCERIARSLLIHDRVPTMAETLAKIDAADRAAIIAQAERIVADRAPTMTLYGPIAGAPTAEALCERLAA